MTESNDVAPAQQFVETLRRRGVVLRVINNRLRHFPSTSFAQMSDAEHATLRRHRAAIIELVRTGASFAPTVSEQQTTAPIVATPAPAVEPALCKFCCGHQCIGQDHPAFSALHFNDSAEVERRRQLEITRHNATLRGWAIAGIERPSYD